MQHVTEVRKENSLLKTKCDLLRIENEQKKSVLVGLRVEHDTRWVLVLEHTPPQSYYHKFTLV